MSEYPTDKDSEPSLAGEPVVAYGPERFASLYSVMTGHVYDASLDDISIIKMIRSGVSRSSIQNIAKHLGITMDVMCDLIHMSPRTLQRKKSHESLGTLVSERIIKIAQVLMTGVQVLGNIEAVRSWLHAPRPALENSTPLSLMDTGHGCDMLLDVLGRIERGVYS